MKAESASQLPVFSRNTNGKERHLRTAESESGRLNVEQMKEEVPLDIAYWILERLCSCFSPDIPYLIIAHADYQSPWDAICGIADEKRLAACVILGMIEAATEYSDYRARKRARTEASAVGRNIPLPYIDARQVPGHEDNETNEALRLRGKEKPVERKGQQKTVAKAKAAGTAEEIIH